MNRKEYLDKLHKSLRAPLGRWKCACCGFIAKSRRELQKHNKSHKLKNGGPGALKGKTKETSEICKKISETLKKKYQSGEIIPPFAGKKLSVLHREKISVTRSKTIDKNLKCGRRIDVGWYKISNIAGKEFTVRGHWEENVAKRLNDLGILWIRNIHLHYKTDIVRTYTPDFYLPMLDSYIEVKGYFPTEDRIKMNTVVQ